MNKRICLIIGIGVAILVCIVLITIFYNDLAINFTKDNYKGEFFKVILTSFGGLGVIYGLYLNSKRIQEQTRQNNISEKVNIDKRFGEAVGYLNSENTGIIIGGIHALYQIAKEDIRYKEVVSNIFCNYIENKSEELQKSNKYDIIKLMLNKLLNGYFTKFSINNSYLKDIKIKNNINDISFNMCEIVSMTFFSAVDCSFNDCHIEYTVFKDISYSIFLNCKLYNCNFIDSINFDKNGFSINSISFCEFRSLNINNLSFEDNVLEQCDFNNCKIANSKFIFFDNSDLVDITFSAVECINTEYENWDNKKIKIDSSCSGFPSN